MVENKKKTFKERKDAFDKIWNYLDKEFIGFDNFQIIGFLESFKQEIMNDMWENKGK